MKKLPLSLLGNDADELSLVNYDIEDVLNHSKVILDQYVLSFLIQGEKYINFGGSAIHVDNSKVLLIAQGNYLMTEKGYGTQDYHSLLIFFSKKKLTELLGRRNKLTTERQAPNKSVAYFLIEQDEFVKTFMKSLSLHFKINRELSVELLEIKFEEIMIYLIDCYGDSIVFFLNSTLQNNAYLAFQQIIETNKYNNLRVEELAFLCNMSISTFKRHFTKTYRKSPAAWFRQNRMGRSEELLKEGYAKPSELHEASGYKNYAHFSTAYKVKFGKSPKHTMIKT